MSWRPCNKPYFAQIQRVWSFADLLGLLPLDCGPCFIRIRCTQFVSSHCAMSFALWTSAFEKDHPAKSPRNSWKGSSPHYLISARALPEEHRRYLVYVSRSFSLFIKATVDGIYTHEFFGDVIIDAGYRKRLRAVV